MQTSKPSGPSNDPECEMTEEDMGSEVRFSAALSRKLAV